ncbi:hypothetical protein FRB99_002916 [Tulasnella sp. 403]|nr:hypothetical protein FRB99_002916 [Tulasnella sp. 403]
MTASSPPRAPKTSTRRQGDPKRSLIGHPSIAPALSADSLANGGKTATRSKAGCMTCRIRRKKCDLERVGDSCKTCVRLRIECLGWGAKRPEALRDPAVVKEIQYMIKMHLASNNMIKGSARSTALPTAGQLPSSHSSPNNPFTHSSLVSTTYSSSASSPGQTDLHFLPPINPRPANAPSYYTHFHYYNPASQASSVSTPGGTAGAGGAYSSPQSFLRFDNLKRDSLGSVDSAATLSSRAASNTGTGASSTRKGKGRQAVKAEAPIEDDIDGSGEEYEDPGDEPPSSFSRHPPGFQPSQYDGQYRPRFPYPLGSPPQTSQQYHNTPHAYAPQSSMRTGYDYDIDHKTNIDQTMRVVEREHEMDMLRRGMQGGPVGGPPAGRHPQDPNAYPSFSHNFVYGPGVGAASAGRSLGPYGTHAGYRGPSPSNSLNSNFATPQRGDPYGGPARPLVDTNSLVPPPLSLNMSRTTSSPHGLPSPYLHPVEHSPQPGSYNAVPTWPPPPPPPLASSFGDSYTFDRRYSDMDSDLSATTAGALVPASGNQILGGATPFENATFASILSDFGLPNAVASGVSATQAVDQTALSMSMAPETLAVWQEFQNVATPAPMVQPLPMYLMQPGHSNAFNSREMELLHLYRLKLCNLQYHIAHSTDNTLADELFELAMTSKAALFGTLTLTSLYNIRLRGLQQTVADEDIREVRHFKDQVGVALNSAPYMPDSGAAMAGLHMVSAVLFEGGTDAQWDEFLDIAKRWVQHHPVVKTGSWSTSPTLDAMGSTASAAVDKKTSFIIKTTAWFDVIGSITMRRAPHFLETYRELFGRQGGAGMERIMGCNEKVLLAIAETAALASWRHEMEKKGCLSVMELVQKASKIQERLDFIGPLYNGETFNSSLSPTLAAAVGGNPLVEEILGLNVQAERLKLERDQAAHTVRLVSNVFRATGQLYLHTVVSGCNPDVPEIKKAVTATVEAFKSLQASAVDRSLVFPIALAGCLTDDKEYRQYLVGRLKALGKQGEAVGNSKR